MQIIKVTNQNQDSAIKLAGRVLRNGGVVVYPTDTAYALGGRFDDPKVIKKVLKIKKRKDTKFTLIASNQKQVEKFFPLNTLQKKLARKFWPGPLSIIINRKYAIRVPDNTPARALAQMVGAPLIATSANISGLATPYTVYAILQQFADSELLPDIIIDGGRLKYKKTSTIIKVLATRDVKIVRQGLISARTIGNSRS